MPEVHMSTGDTHAPTPPPDRFFDDTPLEEMRKDVREARLHTAPSAGGHVWFDFRGIPCCALCSKVRSRTGNKACSKVMPRIGMRSAQG